MGEYIKSKKDMKFQSQDSLKQIQRVIEDADKLLNDKSRRIKDSQIGEALAGAMGIGVGGGVGFAGLYFGGTVVGLSAAGITSGLAAAGGLIGGGMVAGIAVLAAPAVILGGAGASLASHKRNKRLRDSKELIYKNAIAKQTAILKALKEESNADADFLNLPAAVFAQAQHLESDKYTKLGLPIPMFSSINEEFASNLYRSNYDALCFSRDLKITGASFIVSKFIDIIITLVHGLFREEDESKDIFEVRTRKILLISNSIASTSTIVNSTITSNPKNLDIGGLLNTLTRLFGDLRFISKIKKEFINSEISGRLEKEINEIDILYKEM